MIFSVVQVLKRDYGFSADRRNDSPQSRAYAYDLLHRQPHDNPQGRRMKSQQSNEMIGALFPSGSPVRDGNGRMIKDSCSPQKDSQRSCNQAVRVDRPENRCAILHALPLPGDRVVEPASKIMAMMFITLEMD
jgi:hypothetical protein